MQSVNHKPFSVQWKTLFFDPSAVILSRDNFFASLFHTQCYRFIESRCVFPFRSSHSLYSIHGHFRDLNINNNNKNLCGHTVNPVRIKVTHKNTCADTNSLSYQPFCWPFQSIKKVHIRSVACVCAVFSLHFDSNKWRRLSILQWLEVHTPNRLALLRLVNRLLLLN